MWEIRAGAHYIDPRPERPHKLVSLLLEIQANEEKQPAMLTIPVRFHLFEFCDQPWFKGVWREAFMDCLDLLHRLFHPYNKMLPRIAHCAEKIHATEMLDTCSGGGRQLDFLVGYTMHHGYRAPKIIASDLFPRVENYEKLINKYGADKVGYVDQPVNAIDIPESYRMVSMFTALHHFKPKEVREFFRHIVEDKDGVIIAELTERSWLQVLVTPLFTPV